ncbi:MAG TPA: hypothetical protein VIX59_07115, partial [Candidatus Binataceae bacterium]
MVVNYSDLIGFTIVAFENQAARARQCCVAMRTARHRCNSKAISGAWTTIAEYSNHKYVAILRLRQPSLRMMRWTLARLST